MACGEEATPAVTATPTDTATPTPVGGVEPLGTLDVAMPELGAPVFVLKNQAYLQLLFDPLTTNEAMFATGSDGSV